MCYCRNFARKAPELDWEELQQKQEREYQESIGKHQVTATVTVYLTYDDCSPAEAVEFASDYLSQALMEADDFDADMEVK